MNDYLARRDAEMMGEVHRFLGLSVGVIVHDLSDAQRRRAYDADITYGTNNEFGFDYLRDNMKPALDWYVQRELYYAIVDEVDSILIDEARTPLIISGPSEENVALYAVANQVIPRLAAGTKGDVKKDDRGDRRLLGRREAPRRGAHRGGRPQGRAAACASRTSTTRRCCRCCTRCSRR